MKQTRTARRVAVTAFAWCWCWCVQPSLADPLHQVGDARAWQHADSGWLFPRQIGGFVRVIAPYTIDGNNDVGARYEQVADGLRATAVVEVYAEDSAAADAEFANARAALELDAKSATGARLQSEGPFTVDAQRELAGVKVTYAFEKDGRASQTSLYFFDAAGWVVKIRTAAETTDASTSKTLDGFVRHQQWEQLGAATGLH